MYINYCHDMHYAYKESWGAKDATMLTQIQEQRDRQKVRPTENTTEHVQTVQVQSYYTHNTNVTHVLAKFRSQKSGTTYTKFYTTPPNLALTAISNLAVSKNLLHMQ